MSTLVIESGGSKSTWWYELNNQTYHFETVGLHPFELSPEKIEVLKTITEKRKLPLHTRTYFYGAGCESNVGKEVIVNLFTNLELPSPIIATDLLGACIATWGNKEGITAILGTGAIAAHFDGQKITNTASGLGYILGDEGSGFDLGKRLLVRYFNNSLPIELAKLITKHFTSKDLIIKQVYAPTGRKKVADLCPLIYQFKDLKEIQLLLQESFSDFVKTALLPLGKNTEIKTVGSIGYFFNEELKKVLNHYEISLLTSLPSAHEELFKFHRKET
jgi:hypothetical protein